MINEVFQQPGRFTIPFRAESSSLDDIADRVVYPGHIMVLSEWVSPREHSDLEMKRIADYAGVVLVPLKATDKLEVSGQGMWWHLGDSFGTAPILAERRAYTAATPDVVFAPRSSGGVLPEAVPVGNIDLTSVTKTLTTTFEPNTTSNDAVKQALSVFGMHGRVAPDGKFYASSQTVDGVYRTTTNRVTGIQVIAIRNGWGGDSRLEALEPIRIETRHRAEGVATVAVAVDEQYDGSTEIPFVVNLDPNPYYDYHGNPLSRVWQEPRPASDADTSISDYLTAKLAERGIKLEQEIDLDNFDLIGGPLKAGDLIHVYDPDTGFVDYTNPVIFRGETKWSLKRRVDETEMLLQPGNAVFYRPNGPSVTTDDYIDLTGDIEWEA